MLKYVVVCCSVLQRADAVLLQSVAVRCSALQYVAVQCSVLQCVSVCCSVFQCVAVYSEASRPLRVGWASNL